jgi:hypothetical protein
VRTTVLVLMRRRYADLVRLAYLALDDGRTAAPDLLAAARRAVRRAARATTSAAYPRLRHRLVVDLLTTAPRHRPRALLFEPAPGDPGPVRQELRGLSLHERLVYLLCRLEGLTAPEAAAELGEELLVNAWDVDRTLQDVDSATGLDPSAQRAELRAFDPTLVRLRPPPSLSRAAQTLLALAATAVVIVGVVSYGHYRGPAKTGDPVVVGADAWRRGGAPTLADWPTQGALRGDRALLRRAAAAWRADRRDPPLGPVSIMFAGTVDDATVVIMHDAPGNRDSPVIAEYFERRLSRGVESIRALGSDTGEFIMIGTTWRYLVPPWITDISAALPLLSEPSWHPVGVRDGVTDPLPWRWFDPDCQTYMVFQMQFRPATAPPRRITLFASPTPEAGTPLIWFRDPDPRRPDSAFTGDRGQWAVIRAVACESMTSLSDAGDLRVGRLWSGDLPDGGGRAAMISVDVSRPWGTPGTAFLIAEGGKVLTGGGTTNSDFASPVSTIAGTVWWRSSTRWHIIAAAGPGIARLKTVGELDGREARSSGSGTFLAATGPPVHGKGPQESRLPVVRVIVFEPDGDRTLISPG